MFSLDSVLDDLWPQARPAPWQKSLLKRLFYEDEFQQFAAATPPPERTGYGGASSGTP